MIISQRAPLRLSPAILLNNPIASNHPSPLSYPRPSQPGTITGSTESLKEKKLLRAKAPPAATQS